MWTSDVCSQITPDRLRRAAAPVPPADGQPPPRLLVGTTYGGGRVLSLDERGRVVAFGAGQGETTVLAVCPGSERLTEVFVPPESATTRDATVAVRSVNGLSVEREVPLPGSGPAGGVYREVEALLCRDEAARDLLVFVRGDSPDYLSRILQVRGSESATLWEGTATHGAFRPDGRFAYVTAGRQGADLVAIDVAADPVTDRRITAIPEHPGALAVDRMGTVAVPTGGPLAPAYGGPLVLVTIDPSTGGVRLVSVPGEFPSGALVWASDRRLVFVPDAAGEPVRVYDEDLNEVAVWPGLASSRVVVTGGRLFGLDQGVLQSAPVEGGPVVRFAELGDGLPGALAVVPAADGSGGDSGNVPVTAPTVLRRPTRRMATRVARSRPWPPYSSPGRYSPLIPPRGEGLTRSGLEPPLLLGRQDNQAPGSSPAPRSWPRWGGVISATGSSHRRSPPGGRLVESGRGDHAADRRARATQRPDAVGRIDAEAGSFASDSPPLNGRQTLAIDNGNGCPASRSGASPPVGLALVCGSAMCGNRHTAGCPLSGRRRRRTGRTGPWPGRDGRGAGRARRR